MTKKLEEIEGSPLYTFLTGSSEPLPVTHGPVNETNVITTVTCADYVITGSTIVPPKFPGANECYNVERLTENAVILEFHTPQAAAAFAEYAKQHVKK